MSFLDQMSVASLQRVKDLTLSGEPTFTPAPERPLQRRGVIAEVKRSSPSEGALSLNLDVIQQARIYEAAGASAISVLTEPSVFKGSLADLQAVAQAVSIPVMRKDFLVHPLQVREAAHCGASMVLLVVRILDDSTLDAMLAEAERAGMVVLLEAFDAADLLRIHGREEGHLVGVNSRDLSTLEVRPERFAELAPLLPTGATAVAESSLLSAEDVRNTKALGYGMALVGTALMRADEPASLLKEMVNV